MELPLKKEVTKMEQEKREHTYVNGHFFSYPLKKSILFYLCKEKDIKKNTFIYFILYSINYIAMLLSGNISHFRCKRGFLVREAFKNASKKIEKSRDLLKLCDISV